MAPSRSTGVLATDTNLGTPVPVREINSLEKSLRTLAWADAVNISTTYERSRQLPGVHELGRQLLEELRRKRPDFDFQGFVSRNPAFWLAERELAPGDVSLPYLVSMLAVLGHDHVTAERYLALAQASLPLTPIVRHGYARPEAMMLYQNQMLLAGIPQSARMQTVEQCEKGLALLRARIGQWSNRPTLVRALIEMEARRVELLTQDGEHLSYLEQPIGERLDLTPADLVFLRTNDAILADGLGAKVRQWINKQTLAQQWSRWIEMSEPAEPVDMEASVAAYAAHDRWDLAWLTWRCKRAGQGFASREEQGRWKAWSAKLLDAPSAAYLEKTTSLNAQSGQAYLQLAPESFGEAWSGDQNIHPLLAVQIERQVALCDAVLSVMAPGSLGEGSYRLKRAQIMADIDAVENSRRDLQRIREIIHDSDSMQVAPGIKAMETVKIVEARLLDTEGHYVEAHSLYESLVKNPRLVGIQINFANHLFMSGDLTAAHRQYRAYALEHPTDTYRSIMADLTARRLGMRENQLLDAARRQGKAESWSASGVRYLMGDLSEDELLQEARKGTTFEIIQHECEASFWIAQVALAAGQREEGIKWLHRCIATGFISFSEYKVARAELQRLEPKSEKNDKDSTPANSRGVITT